MSVHKSLLLKYRFKLRIVYITFWRMSLMVPSMSISRWRTQRIENDDRLENKSRVIEDG